MGRIPFFYYGFLIIFLISIPTVFSREHLEALFIMSPHDLGYATVSQEINVAAIKDWLNKSKNIKIDFSNPIGVIVDIIENREKDFSNEIKRLWKIEKIY